MSLSQEELKKIAEKLSKIPGDNEKLLGNISDILTYMDLLTEVDTHWVQETISVVDTPAILRWDTQSQTCSSPDELLGASKQQVVARQIILPNIMN